jgi:thiol:disulfide interchange protein DsbD
MEREARDAVRVSLLTDLTHAAPGQIGTLALQFTIAPKWHLYWRNSGDTGQPISFEWTTPAGVTIGEAQWPVPMRHEAPGDILDYIYEGQTTLLFPFTIDSAAAGSTLEVQVKLDWLVCKEACVPGGTTLSLTLPTGTAPGSNTSAPNPGVAVITKARAALPLETSDARSPAAETAWTGAELRVRVPGAERLVFLPYESDEATPLNLLEQGDIAGDQAVVRYASSVQNAERVRAVLGVQKAGVLTYRVLDVAGPGAGAAPAR